MCYWRKSRANRHVPALLKAVEKSRWERVEYDVAPIRHRAYDGVVYDERGCDFPARTNWRERSWKKHRRSQYKM